MATFWGIRQPMQEGDTEEALHLRFMKREATAYDLETVKNAQETVNVLKKDIEAFIKDMSERHDAWMLKDDENYQQYLDGKVSALAIDDESSPYWEFFETNLFSLSFRCGIYGSKEMYPVKSWLKRAGIVERKLKRAKAKASKV